MNGQHDDHCWITFMYRNWKIKWRRGHVLWLYNPDNPSEKRGLDISEVRWNEYQAVAIEMMKEAGL